MHVYIYIERERERDTHTHRARMVFRVLSTYIRSDKPYMCAYTYIHITYITRYKLV